MDAGLAAVLGALAGAVATTGAAFATGWSAREQAKIAARGEHRRQRRDARHTVYEEFIATVGEQMAHAAPLFEEDPPEDGDELGRHFQSSGVRDTTSLLGDCYRLHNNVMKTLTKVQLAGPKDVTTTARRVCNHSFALATSLASIVGTPYRVDFLRTAFQHANDRLQKLDMAVDAFIEAAQTALDDDGTMS
ncbi:hypothetical protein [Streptomyces bicolor]|uniref:hypothetical protein n=1 Tax=Streptomyces bicolor TaxID=66874 RepID=UPI00131DF2D5|nr:hypothetical protein [Streptomyces bicolor]